MSTSVRMSSDSDVYHNEIASGIRVICCPKTLCWTDINCDVVSALKKEGMVPNIVKSPKDAFRMASHLTLNVPTVIVVCDHNKNILKSASEGVIQDHMRNIILVMSRHDTEDEFNRFDITVLQDALDSQELVGMIRMKTESRHSHVYTNGFLKWKQQNAMTFKNDDEGFSQTYRRTVSLGSLTKELHERQSQMGAYVQRDLRMRPDSSGNETNRSSNDVIEDIFINTKSGCPEEGLRGVFVRQRTYASQENQAETFPIFLERFLSADENEIEHHTRVINTSLIPYFREKNDFVSLIQLMKGGDLKLQRQLAEVAFDIQLKSKDRSCNIEILLVGINTFVDLCQRDYSDTDLAEKYTPILLNTVSILLSCLVLRDSDGDTIHHVLSNCCQALTTTSGVRGKGHTAANCLYPITEILTCIVHQLRSNSKLQKAKYKDAVSNRKLHKYVQKMSFLDIYSLFLDILQRLKQKSITEDVPTLKYMVACLLDKHHKQAKTEPLTHAILMCITQGVVTLIKDACARNEQGVSEELNIMELLGVMDLYFDSRKFGQVIRTRLLREVECLLFLKDKELVHTVWYWHNISGLQSQQLQNKTIEYIETLLQPLSFQILRADFVPSIAFSPAWCTLHGTSIGHRDVTLHCLLPSLQCLLDGSMADYKVKANKDETKFEINTLEILRTIQAEGNHPGILALHAYQCRPIPLFFVVDRYKGADLFSYLHQRRKDKNWINLSALAKIASEVISAVDFLHLKKVVHRNLTASSFALDSRRRLVLTDFSIAKHVDASEISVSDLEGTGVPTRWTAPESLLEGRFDIRTDTWMVGQLLYEIYTHGCQPFVELYTISTEKVMEWVVFQKLTPKQWPCIPRNVHDVILRCVHIEAEERVTLSSVRGVFLTHRYSPANARQNPSSGSTKKMAISSFAEPRLPVSRACDEDRMYPDIPVGQREGMVIERGIPKLFLDLRKGRTGPRNSYIYWNARRVQRIVSSNLEATQQDLLAPDQPSYTAKSGYIEVTEPVTQAFVENVYPLLTGHVMNWFHIRHWPVVVQNHPSTGIMDFNCTLVYGCEPGENILDFALANRLGNPSAPEKMAKYYGIVQSLARLISCMHAKDFILRDLCAANIYFCESSGKVFIPRLGRILHLGSNCTLDDSILSEKAPNRNRWMPIEVLQSAQYSKQSDMYMFAMTLYEFFMALDSFSKNPNADILKTVPFATVKTNLLLEHLYRGETPEKPPLCPGWVYEIMQKCWDRDRTRRPDIADVERMLHDRLSGKAVEVTYDYDTLHQPPKHKRTTPSSIYRIGRVPLRSKSCNQLVSRDLSFTPVERVESMLGDMDSECSCDKSSDCDSFKSDLPVIPVTKRSGGGRRRVSKETVGSMYEYVDDNRSSRMDVQPRNDPMSMYDTISGLTPKEIHKMKQETDKRKGYVRNPEQSSHKIPNQPNRNLNEKMPTPVEQMMNIPVPTRSATLPTKKSQCVQIFNI